MKLSIMLRNIISTLQQTFKDHSPQLISQFSLIYHYLYTQPDNHSDHCIDENGSHASIIHKFIKNSDLVQEAIAFYSNQRAFLLLHLVFPDSKESLQFIEFNPSPELHSPRGLPTLKELALDRKLGNIATISSIHGFQSGDIDTSIFSSENDLITFLELIEDTFLTIEGFDKVYV